LFHRVLDPGVINFLAADSRVIELIYELLQAHPFVDIVKGVAALCFLYFVVFYASDDLKNDGGTEVAHRKCDSKPEEHQDVLLRQPIAKFIAEQFLVPGVSLIVTVIASVVVIVIVLVSALVVVVFEHSVRDNAVFFIGREHIIREEYVLVGVHKHAQNKMANQHPLEPAQCFLGNFTVVHERLAIDVNQQELIHEVAKDEVGQSDGVKDDDAGREEECQADHNQDVGISFGELKRRCGVKIFVILFD
jgi:hypothetical protein